METIETLLLMILLLQVASIFIWVYFKKKEIDLLERFALSFALSISVIPLISFYFNPVIIICDK